MRTCSATTAERPPEVARGAARIRRLRARLRPRRADAPDDPLAGAGDAFRRFPAAALGRDGRRRGRAGRDGQPRPGDRARHRSSRRRAAAGVPRARPRRLRRRRLRPLPGRRPADGGIRRGARAEAEAVGRERDARLESVDDPKDERALRKRYEERAKREARRAEWDELRLAVDTIGLWYHDMLADGPGAGEAMVNSDMAGGARRRPRRGAEWATPSERLTRSRTCAARSS